MLMLEQVAVGHLNFLAVPEVAIPLVIFGSQPGSVAVGIWRTDLVKEGLPAFLGRHLAAAGADVVDAGQDSSENFGGYP
jgi:hypothetical protein